MMFSHHFGEKFQRSKILRDRSLKVFSKCIFHFHCHCRCLCICLCRCLFVGKVMFSHDPHQFCEFGGWSSRLESFESNTITRTVNNQGRPRAARSAKKI